MPPGSKRPGKKVKPMQYSNAVPCSEFVERRISPREVFTVTLQYSYGEVKDELLHGIRGMGVSSNLCGAGMGFYTDRGFSRGQCVMLYTPQVNQEPLCAEVRWCSPHSKGLYKIGVAFRPEVQLA